LQQKRKGDWLSSKRSGRLSLILIRGFFTIGGGFSHRVKAWRKYLSAIYGCSQFPLVLTSGYAPAAKATGKGEKLPEGS